MNSVGTTRIVKYSPRVVSKRNRTPKKVRVKKSCEPMLVRKCKSVRRKSRKPVRRRSKSARRRSKPVRRRSKSARRRLKSARRRSKSARRRSKSSRRKSRKPIRKRSKSVRRRSKSSRRTSRKPIRRRSKSVRKRSKIPQKLNRTSKSTPYHKPLVEKKKTPRKIRVEKSQPSLIRQMSIVNPRDILRISDPKDLPSRPYTPLYLERVPAPPGGYRGMSPYSRFKKHTRMSPGDKRKRNENGVLNDEPLQSRRKIDDLCRKLECYTRINENSFKVISDYNAEKTTIIEQEADMMFSKNNIEERIKFIIEKSRKSMFEDLFTFMWGKIMSDTDFKVKMGINQNLEIIVFPYMVLDLEYGKELVPQIEQFINRIKMMDTNSWE